MLVSIIHDLIVGRKERSLTAVPEPGQWPGLRDVGAWLMAIGKRRAIDLRRRRDRLELGGGRRLLGLGCTVALAALLGSGPACVAQSRSASGPAGPEAAHSAATNTPAQGATTP